MIANGDNETNILYLNTYSPDRFISALYGVEWCWDNRGVVWFHGYQALRDFSYNNSSSMGYYYPIDTYLVVTKMDKVIARWEKDRLYLLESDPAATLVYKDGEEIEIWFIESGGEQ